jgi:hypothetical protein
MTYEEMQALNRDTGRVIAELERQAADLQIVVDKIRELREPIERLLQQTRGGEKE